MTGAEVALHLYMGATWCAIVGLSVLVTVLADRGLR